MGTLRIISKAKKEEKVDWRRGLVATTTVIKKRHTQRGNTRMEIAKQCSNKIGKEGQKREGKTETALRFDL